MNTCNECEHLTLSMELMADQIKNIAQRLDRKSIKKTIEYIMGADSIFIMGAGRSGLVGKAFAMRLMHLGFTSYVVGESTTPAVHKNDVVIAISGSGETRSVSDLGRIAKDIGATLITVTSNKDSTLGHISDATLEIHGRSKEDAGGYLERHMRGEYSHLTPLGTSFEISSLVFLDALVAELIFITGASEADLKSRHAKLE
ncbi:6-phospho-3-hexuloisomerase [Methanohalophilus portucalensis]|uniref:3-hexulose-6-phosphate isomerase n=2 Tax=Methanohalophilus portucalensis TaxID=39664 RepID=A0A1L9C226_9EURY|nr:6-phospho-3-hexuloisomerase [Methanohalophilus portucalensis]ATU07372.1 6-phospho 3-hexuloisomerase [Methanohalophilus portucalensis]OJH48579.1 3-hexulose-6-phosphate isomerase [Methanohalophilus portucalensis FDF-1]RNI09482.1 6-phospho-3-hexuloisomerase [Methanohalophilus portucalensis FDF-1]SMH39767.1 3-hexulose-6-phosphate isomerase [Methanohalophilus portucalensis FDF-1]